MWVLEKEETLRKEKTLLRLKFASKVVVVSALATSVRTTTVVVVADTRVGDEWKG